MIAGSTDAARQIPITLAATLIAVVGVAFSIILVALTLTSARATAYGRTIRGRTWLTHERHPRIPDVDSINLINVLSATIAGGAVVVAAVVTSGRLMRQEELRRDADRDQRRVDARRDAYAAVLSAAGVVMNRWWELIDLVRHGEMDTTQGRDFYDRVLTSWDGYTTAAAVARMYGPSSVIQAIDKLSEFLSQYDDLAQDLRHAVLAGKKTSFDKFDRATVNFNEVRNEFGQTAGAALNISA